MKIYVHKTNHRVRVRSSYIRDHYNEVSTLISQLESIDAIRTIKHKKHAGSVAVSFDPNELHCDDLLEIFESHGWLEANGKPSVVERAISMGTKTFAKGLATMALKRITGPSISRIILSL